MTNNLFDDIFNTINNDLEEKVINNQPPKFKPYKPKDIIKDTNIPRPKRDDRIVKDIKEDKNYSQDVNDSKTNTKLAEFGRQLIIADVINKPAFKRGRYYR